MFTYIVGVSFQHGCLRKVIILPSGHYGDRLMQAFEKHGGPMKVLRYAFVAGESSKNRETKAAIEDVEGRRIPGSHDCSREPATSQQNESDKTPLFLWLSVKNKPQCNREQP